MILGDENKSLGCATLWYRHSPVLGYRFGYHIYRVWYLHSYQINGDYDTKLYLVRSALSALNMIGIIVKALLGNTWHTWPLITSMVFVKRGKQVLRGQGLCYNDQVYLYTYLTLFVIMQERNTREPPLRPKSLTCCPRFIFFLRIICITVVLFFCFAHKDQKASRLILCS